MSWLIPYILPFLGHGYYLFQCTHMSELSLLSLAAASSFHPIALLTAPLLTRFIYISHWSLMPFLSCLLPPLHFWKYSHFQPRTCYPSPCFYWSPLGSGNRVSMCRSFYLLLASLSLPVSRHHVTSQNFNMLLTETIQLCTEHLCTRSKML
jgi:hypothetical protein